MVGVLYRKEDNVILILINNVVSYTEDEIMGENASVKGIDLSEASFCILESTELNVGDILGTFTDIRDQLPKTPDQLRIEQLETQLASQNENNAAFMDFVIQTLGV